VGAGVIAVVADKGRAGGDAMRDLLFFANGAQGGECRCFDEVIPPRVLTIVDEEMILFFKVFRRWRKKKERQSLMGVKEREACSGSYDREERKERKTKINLPATHFSRR